MQYKFLKSFTREEHGLLLVLASVQFSNIVDFMILMPLGPQLMRILEINPQQFGWLVSSYTLFAGLSALAAGFFVDRFDRKKTLLFFLAGFIIGTFCCGLAHSYHQLLLARGLTGLFGGVLSSVVLSIVGDSFPENRRGAATGIVMAAFSVAAVMGVPISLILAALLNWRLPFFALAGLAAFLFVVAKTQIPPMRSHLGKQVDTSSASEFAKVAILPIFLMALLVLGQFSVIPFISPSLVFNVGISEHQLPFVYLVGGLFTMITSPWIGRLCDRYGTRPVFLICVTISTIPVWIITHLGSTPLVFVLMFTGLFFITIGGRMIPAISLINNLIPARRRGMMMSIISATQQFSSALAAAISGSIVEKDSSGHLLHYSRVGYLSLSLSGLVFLLVWLVPFPRLQNSKS